MRVQYETRESRPGSGALAAAGIVLGMGFAAFFDGIVFHQVLQWHHMASSVPGYPATTVPGLEANTVFDGLFHAAAYVVLATGVLLLWRALRAGRAAARSRWFWGALLLGAGSFNVLEGLLNHVLLGLHHVREGPNAAWYDAGLLLLGALVAAAGVSLMRSSGRSAAVRERHPPGARAA